MKKKIKVSELGDNARYYQEGDPVAPADLAIVRALIHSSIQNGTSGVSMGQTVAEYVD